MIRTICLAAALLAAACTRPTDDLEHRLDEALKGRRARIGVAVRTPDGRTTVSYTHLTLPTKLVV